MQKRASLYLACAAMLTGCSTAPILGGDDPIAKGAASGQQAVAATEKLERCTEPLGTVGFAEAGDDPYVPIVQMLVQQSNCFIVVERGRAYNQIDLERQLKEAGLTGQAGAANRKMLAADYTMVPTVTFAEPSGFGLSTGLGGFGLGGLFGRRGNNIDTSAQVQALGASTTLRLIDNSSGAQIVAAQGSAKNYNLGAGVGLLGGMLAGVNAYASTPQGKIVTAAFLDAYNKLVQAARQYLPQQTHGSAGQGGRLQGPQ